MHNFNRSLKGLVPVLLLAATITACDDSPTSTPPPTGIQTPTAYTFDSRFKTGTSSVSYEGQVVRNLLADDMRATITALGRAGANAASAANLLKLYEHKDADNLNTLTAISGKTLLETQYNKISTGKDLMGKISSETVIGMNKTADQLIREWIQVIMFNAQDPGKLGTPAVYTDANGLDLRQMIDKVLAGSVSYYQATGVYLNGILQKENGTPEANGIYTTMEHNWDEAFGYFGAARDFARYTDAQTAGASTEYTFDSNGDGKIDLRSEFNYSHARYAGKRDKDAQGVDFSKSIFDAFLKGRTAIVNQASTQELTAQRAIISENWEKVIASTLVHYLNDVRDDMAKIGTVDEKRADLNSHWAEMKGSAIGLQFNPMKLISNAQLEQINTLLGSAPVYANPGTAEHTAYLQALDQAKVLLKTVYGFSDANMTAW